MTIYTCTPTVSKPHIRGKHTDTVWTSVTHVHYARLSGVERGTTQLHTHIYQAMHIWGDFHICKEQYLKVGCLVHINQRLDRVNQTNLVMFLPSKLEPSEIFLPKEAFPTQVGSSDLCTGEVVQVVPVNVGSTVVIGVYQLVSEHVIHVPLRVDVVLTQDNLHTSRTGGTVVSLLCSHNGLRYTPE